MLAAKCLLPPADWPGYIPNDLSDETFFDANALPVDSNISGPGQATLSYTTTTSDNNFKFDWQWKRGGGGSNFTGSWSGTGPALAQGRNNPRA